MSLAHSAQDCSQNTTVCEQLSLCGLQHGGCRLSDMCKFVLCVLYLLLYLLTTRTQVSLWGKHSTKYIKFNHLHPIWLNGVPQVSKWVSFMFYVIVEKAFAENSRFPTKRILGFVRLTQWHKTKTHIYIYTTKFYQIWSVLPKRNCHSSFLVLFTIASPSQFYLHRSMQEGYGWWDEWNVHLTEPKPVMNRCCTLVFQRNALLISMCL